MPVAFTAVRPLTGLQSRDEKGGGRGWGGGGGGGGRGGEGGGEVDVKASHHHQHLFLFLFTYIFLMKAYHHTMTQYFLERQTSELAYMRRSK